jgi:hypothetical protein
MHQTSKKFACWVFSEVRLNEVLGGQRAPWELERFVKFALNSTKDCLRYLLDSSGNHCCGLSCPQAKRRRRTSATLATQEDRTLREQIQARLEKLKKELETGQAELQKVEMQRTYLHETVLRISGAVQVLEELLARQPQEQQDGPDHSEAPLEPTQERARREADRSVTQQTT